MDSMTGAQTYKKHILNGITFIAVLFILTAACLFLTSISDVMIGMGIGFSKTLLFAFLIVAIVSAIIIFTTFRKTPLVKAGRITMIAIVVFVVFLPFNLHRRLMYENWKLECFNDNREACSALAWSYANGLHGAVNSSKADVLNQKACGLGDFLGCLEISEITLKQPSEELCENMRFYCKKYNDACHKGNMTSCDSSFCQFAKSSCSDEDNLP